MNAADIIEIGGCCGCIFQPGVGSWLRIFRYYPGANNAMTSQILGDDWEEIRQIVNAFDMTTLPVNTMTTLQWNGAALTPFASGPFPASQLTGSIGLEAPDSLSYCNILGGSFGVTISDGSNPDPRHNYLGTEYFVVCERFQFTLPFGNVTMPGAYPGPFPYELRTTGLKGLGYSYQGLPPSFGAPWFGVAMTNVIPPDTDYTEIGFGEAGDPSTFVNLVQLKNQNTTALDLKMPPKTAGYPKFLISGAPVIPTPLEGYLRVSLIVPTT